MKKITMEVLTDQKRMTSHLLIMILSLVVTGYFAFVRQDPPSGWMLPVFFFGFFMQIEVFLIIARLVFGRFEQAKTKGQITRRAMGRFIVFYLACLMAAFAIYLVLKAFISLQTGETYKVILKNFFGFEFIGWFKSTTSGLVLGGVIFLAVLWQDALSREQKLREENLIFQNETLRNQVNPHFLFNSLNTISSLIQTQPENAENFINNLSSFYRYILENGQKNRVSLQAELDFLKEYFSMYKVRDENKIFLNIEPLDTGKYEILPVSLQILIENAVKHNMATRESPLSIKVFVENQYIVVKNNLQRKAMLMNTTGIGLRNLAERIRLSQNRDLIVEESKTEFIVKVPLIQ